MRISIWSLAALVALTLSACGGSGSAGGGASAGGGDATQTAGSHTAAASTGATGTATTDSSSATTTAQGTSTAPASTSGSGGAAIAGQQCRAAGLSLSFLGGQGATGHGELGFELRNTGAACSTGGYPGILFLDKSGGPLPTTPDHTTSDFFGQLPLRTLNVATGQSVSFRLGVSHGQGSSAGCVTAYGLQVIPPNDTATLRVSIPQGAIECGQTTVSPLQPGDSAYH